MVAREKDEKKHLLNSQVEAFKKCESEKELLIAKLKETTEKLMESIETQSLLEVSSLLEESNPPKLSLYRQNYQD